VVVARGQAELGAGVTAWFFSAARVREENKE
jgi:hypothetical protein